MSKKGKPIKTIDDDMMKMILAACPPPCSAFPWCRDPNCQTGRALLRNGMHLVPRLSKE